MSGDNFTRSEINVQVAEGEHCLLRWRDSPHDCSNARRESSVGVNDEQTPSGRPAGSLMWAGLANLFSWIDRKNGIGGYWGSQILPFQDAASYPGLVDFESAVYRNR
jgi:hypothetical protein